MCGEGPRKPMVECERQAENGRFIEPAASALKRTDPKNATQRHNAFGWRSVSCRKAMRHWRLALSHSWIYSQISHSPSGKAICRIFGQSYISTNGKHIEVIYDWGDPRECYRCRVRNESWTRVLLRQWRLNECTMIPNPGRNFLKKLRSRVASHVFCRGSHRSRITRPIADLH